MAWLDDADDALEAWFHSLACDEHTARLCAVDRAMRARCVRFGVFDRCGTVFAKRARPLAQKWAEEAPDGLRAGIKRRVMREMTQLEELGLPVRDVYRDAEGNGWIVVAAGRVSLYILLDRHHPFKAPKLFVRLGENLLMDIERFTYYANGLRDDPRRRAGWDDARYKLLVWAPAYSLSDLVGWWRPLLEDAAELPPAVVPPAGGDGVRSLPTPAYAA